MDSSEGNGCSTQLTSGDTQRGSVLLFSLLVLLVVLAIAALAFNVVSLGSSLEQHYQNSQAASQGALLRFTPAECINWPGKTDYRSTADVDGDGVPDGANFCSRLRLKRAALRNYPKNSLSVSACPIDAAGNLTELEHCLLWGLAPSEEMKGSIAAALQAIADVTATNTYVSRPETRQTAQLQYAPNSLTLDSQHLVFGRCQLSVALPSPSASPGVPSSGSTAGSNFQHYDCFTINRDTKIVVSGRELSFPYTYNFVNASRVDLSATLDSQRSLGVLLGYFLGANDAEFRSGITVAHFDPTRAWQCGGYPNIAPLKALKSRNVTWSAAPSNKFSATPTPSPPPCQPELPLSS